MVLSGAQSMPGGSGWLQNCIPDGSRSPKRSSVALERSKELPGSKLWKFRKKVMCTKYTYLACFLMIDKSTTFPLGNFGGGMHRTSGGCTRVLRVHGTSQESVHTCLFGPGRATWSGRTSHHDEFYLKSSDRFAISLFVFQDGPSWTSGRIWMPQSVPTDVLCPHRTAGRSLRAHLNIQ